MYFYRDGGSIGISFEHLVGGAYVDSSILIHQGFDGDGIWYLDSTKGDKLTEDEIWDIKNHMEHWNSNNTNVVNRILNE